MSASLLPRSLEFRQAQTNELEAAAALICQSFYALDTLLFLVAPLIQWGIWQDLNQRQRQGKQGYGCFIATHPQTAHLLGVVEVELRLLESNFPYKKGIPRPYLSNLAVHPDYRRQGIGQQLIQTVEAWLIQHQHPEVYLHVLASNTIAQGLYQQLGYQLRATDAHWLLPTRLLLSKTLSSLA
ncbi:GNAT family N-acetyltransferase [Synechococcus sp. PCC 6312]|uniref:GNAT family N-acetyltransferase n=1 Tax=Synechococcus sp. (strain ATCC 27167 / PCC 6312) TaxID=195253 RepID=UPI00029EC944|nr:GNAT family N-acetyltransferase [Synechococcus sp. PCC 6312]AFY62078.1 acetyltransferase [Synechococcus sp. PCC 6312]